MFSQAEIERIERSNQYEQALNAAIKAGRSSDALRSCVSCGKYFSNCATGRHARCGTCRNRKPQEAQS